MNAYVEISKELYSKIVEAKIAQLKEKIARDVGLTLSVMASNLRMRKTFWKGKPVYDENSIEYLRSRPFDIYDSLYDHPLVDMYFRDQKIEDYDIDQANYVEMIYQSQDDLRELEECYKRLYYVFDETMVQVNLLDIPTAEEAETLGISELLRAES